MKSICRRIESVRRHCHDPLRRQHLRQRHDAGAPYDSAQSGRLPRQYREERDEDAERAARARLQRLLLAELHSHARIADLHRSRQASAASGSTLPDGSSSVSSARPASSSIASPARCTTTTRTSSKSHSNRSSDFRIERDAVPRARKNGDQGQRHRLRRVGHRRSVRGLGRAARLGTHDRRRLARRDPPRPRPRRHVLRHRRQLWLRPQRVAPRHRPFAQTAGRRHRARKSASSARRAAS